MKIIKLLNVLLYRFHLSFIFTYIITYYNLCINMKLLVYCIYYYNETYFSAVRDTNFLLDYYMITAVLWSTLTFEYYFLIFIKLLTSVFIFMNNFEKMITTFLLYSTFSMLDSEFRLHPKITSNSLSTFI